MKKGIYFLLPFILLASCTKNQQTTAPTPGNKHGFFGNNASTNESNLKEALKLKSASQVTSWNLSGAIATRTAKKGWSASLNWLQQGPQQYQIRLSGPLGGGTIIINKQGGMVTYQDGPKKLTSKSAEELLQRQTGIRLPVQNLYYWVRGIPAPGGVRSASYDSDHHLMQMSQSGYTISYGNYQVVNQVALPGKIFLQGHQVTIKLIVKNWGIS